MAMKRVELELTRARVMDTQAFVDGRTCTRSWCVATASVQLEGNLKPMRGITVRCGAACNYIGVSQGANGSKGVFVMFNVDFSSGCSTHGPKDALTSYP